MRVRKTFRLTTLVGRVYNVDGVAMRQKRALAIGGGHHLVYRWVPRNEVWIERMRGGARDERCILAHEMAEILLMRVRGWSYDRAHDAANRVEQQLRAGRDANATFARFVKRYFPRADAATVRLVASDLTRSFRDY